jgi:hypothetical protein
MTLFSRLSIIFVFSGVKPASDGPLAEPSEAAGTFFVGLPVGFAAVASPVIDVKPSTIP